MSSCSIARLHALYAERDIVLANPSVCRSVCIIIIIIITSCAGGRNNMLPPRVTLTFDLLTLKVVSESRVTWATSVPILVFLGLFVLDLDRMYATDRQTDRRQTSDSIIAKCLRLGGGGIITFRNYHPHTTCLFCVPAVFVD